MSLPSTRSLPDGRIDQSHHRAVIGCSVLVVLSVIVALLPIPTGPTLMILVGLAGIPLVVLYLGSGDVFSPAAFVGLAYLMGWFGPVVDFVATGDTTDVLLGQGLEYLVSPLVLAVAGIGCLAVGMCWTPADRIVARIPTFRREWDDDRANRVVALCTTIGVGSLFLLFWTTGGVPTALSELSAKRRPPTEYIAWGTKLLFVAALVDLGTVVRRTDRSRNRVAVTGALVAIACIPPFYRSIRSSLLLFLISLVVVYHYTERRVKLAHLLALVPLGVVTINVMGSLRKASWMGASALDPSTTLRPGAIGDFFGARRTGVTVHAHLFHVVPDRIGFQYGTTLLSWVTRPIPRQLWPGKPRDIGQVLGERIFHQGVGTVGGGTPPPVPAELYLNFWIPGVLVGMFLFGACIRIGYNYCEPGSGGLPRTLIYSIFATTFVFGILYGNVSQLVTNLLQLALPLLLALGFISGDWTAIGDDLGR
ncbi:oligosaccharide repeat unit polymerase [Natrinema salsiterrestre]|uniref:Oligosaccharide repeat unit polymerase n=1 Tax=Natrinema salsiterrestre TaxID=2950540 RepID=A0A9Q4Q187_9EURY|nr:oligosaccharide repeat unit polymerase [Natrinema salsiterrestre]MDF9743988.1 oligosaccharide repeat unit polymerase [Natrinema salsiterrestre]